MVCSICFLQFHDNLEYKLHLSTHKKGVLAPATLSAVPSKKVDCAKPDPKLAPDDQNKSDQAETMTTETEGT